MNKKVDWTAALIQRLRELHAEGLTYGMIANRLKVEFKADVTRNAIIGKAHRLSLPARDPVPPPPRVRKEHKEEPERITKMKEAPPLAPRAPPTIGALNIIDLTDAVCHWPLGDHPHVTYCGKPATFRLYCEEHARISYVIPGKRWD